MTAISAYWASVGVRVDNKDLSKVDAYLAKIENKLKQGISNSKVAFTPKINIPAFEKHIRSVLRSVGTGDKNALRVNVRVSESHLRKSIESTTIDKPVTAKVVAKLDKGSITTIKEQLRAALSDLLINARLGNVLGKASVGQHKSPQKQNTGATVGDALSNAQLNTIRKQIARGIVGNSNSPEYWSQIAKLQVKTQQELLSQLQKIKGGTNPNNSWSPNARGNMGAGLSVIERLQGTVPKGSNSAAVRRHFDSMMSEAFVHPNAPQTLRQFAGEATIGAIGRVGTSTMLGRGLGIAGNMIGGARLGAFGVAAGAALNLGVSATKAIWSGLATTIAAPFKLAGGAVSAVTSGFYRLALTIAPLVGGFMMLNRTVQQSSQRQIALNTISKSLGSEGRVESAWLMNMANRDGMRYNTLIDPYTTFIASASPAMGLNTAKDVFESFTQFGLTRGSNDIAMGLAMKAVAQMAGKGKVGAEELRQQLGDAPGFGEMQGIFAQAYQMSLGRSESQQKKGQAAIEELYKQMELGNVYSAKVLPYVAEIARRMAEQGLAEARSASFAEQARFDNQVSKGWANFREGGGESGLAYFWRMAQQMGSWWERNGNTLGGYFEVLVTDLNTLRVGLKEFFEFSWAGKENDLTDILKESLGIDAVAFREQVIAIGNQISDLFERLAVVLGFKKEGSYIKGISDKFAVFVENFSKILTHVDGMLGAIERFLLAWNNFSALPIQTKIGAVLPTTPGYKEMSNLINAAGSFVAHGVGATLSAGETQVDVATGSENPTPKVPPIIPQTPYRRPDPWGDNTIPPISLNNSTPAAPSDTTSPSVKVPPLNLLPQTDPQQMYTPAKKNVTEQTLNGNVNITLKVEGNPDLAGQLANPEVQSVVRKQVEDGIKNMLISTLPEAPQY